MKLEAVERHNLHFTDEDVSNIQKCYDHLVEVKNMACRKDVENIFYEGILGKQPIMCDTLRSRLGSAVKNIADVLDLFPKHF